MLPVNSLFPVMFVCVVVVLLVCVCPVAPGLSCLVVTCSGAELHAGLAVSEEVEDHRSRLHLLSSRREHEEEEPDRLQHGGGRGGVCICNSPRICQDC